MIVAKGELSMRQKNLRPERNQTHDFLNTRVQEVMGLIPARDSYFFLPHILFSFFTVVDDVNFNPC